jgi:hypothetical protein
MFGRQHNNDLGGGAAHGWGWPRSDRARRRDRERADAEAINELKWQWRSACQGTPLAPMVYTPSGPSRAVPIIGHIDLGPPVVFTVRIRPGQTIADFVAAAPAIAPAFGVADLQITPLVPQWVKIVFVTYALEAVPDLPAELRFPSRVGA